jgi:hypothetical protein
MYKEALETGMFLYRSTVRGTCKGTSLTEVSGNGTSLTIYRGLVMGTRRGGGLIFLLIR